MTPLEPASPTPLLEEALRRAMAAGIELTDAVCRYMAATIGDASPGALEKLLEDDSDVERDSLLDLLFFPDQSLQAAIESILEEHPLSASDTARLARRFKTTPLAARFRFPGTDRTIPATLAASGVDAFLDRLNLTWTPAAHLEKALDRLDARPLSPDGSIKEGRVRLRVWLRNAALIQTPVQVRFLCDFLERLPLEGEAFVDHLHFSLVFLKEHQDAGNLYAALMDRKRFIYRHLLESRRAAERTARSNMETLVMTGVRTPYFDVAYGEQTLAMIDHIAVAVFGRTEMLEGIPLEVDLGDPADGLEPAELIRRLS